MAKIRFILDNFYDSAAVKASYLDKMVFTNVNVGTAADTVDVNTGFTFTRLANGINPVTGYPGVAESTRILFVAGTLLDGTYWMFDTPSADPTKDFYVWYNTGASSDPGPVGSRTGIEISILVGDTSDEVASKTRIALDLASETNGFITIDDNGFFSTLPGTNLKNISRSQFARTEPVDTDGDTINDDVGFQVYGTFSSAKDISAIVFGRHNWPEDTTYKIRFYSDNDYTTLIAPAITGTISASDAGSNLTGWNNFNWGQGTWVPTAEGVEPFDPATNYVIWLDKGDYDDAWSFKIDIDAEAAVIDFLDTGRIFIGDYIEPTYNLSFGHTLQWIENTTQFRTQAGTLRSDSAIPFRKFTFDFSVISEADRIILQHKFRAVGLRLDFYFSAFSDATDEDREIDYSAIAKITKVPKFTEFQCSYFKSKYELEEV